MVHGDDARGIAPELLKAPDRRRTLASAGLLFFSYIYRRFLLPLTFSLLFTYYFLSFQTEKGSLAFSSFFFFFFFFYHKKRTKYYSAHKLVGFAPTHIHDTTSPMSPIYTHTMYTLYFARANFWLKTFGVFFFFFIIAVKHDPRKRVVCWLRKCLEGALFQRDKPYIE